MLYKFSETEEILRIAVKLPTMSIKYLAQETGLSLQGLYNWSAGYSHLSPQRMDIIIQFLRDVRPDVLAAVIKEYSKKENNLL